MYAFSHTVQNLLNGKILDAYFQYTRDQCRWKWDISFIKLTSFDRDTNHSSIENMTKPQGNVTLLIFCVRCTTFQQYSVYTLVCEIFCSIGQSIVIASALRNWTICMYIPLYSEHCQWYSPEVEMTSVNCGTEGNNKCKLWDSSGKWMEMRWTRFYQCISHSYAPLTNIPLRACCLLNALPHFFWSWIG